MLYEYYCEACDKVFELDFKMGEAPKTSTCECGKSAERYFGNVGFILKGGGWPSKTGRTKAQQTANNEAAGKRMHKNRDKLKTVAHDYGNGNVKEV